MLAADNNLLKATLTVGILEIQQNLVTLYLNNINAVAQQTILFTAFAYTGIAEVVMDINTPFQYAWGFAYYILQSSAVGNESKTLNILYLL